MRRSCRLGLALVFVALQGGRLASQDLAVRAEKLHTQAGPVIDDGVVIIQDGRIVAVGPAASTPIPAGLRVVTGRIATPGLIDAHSVVGLAGALNQPHDQDEQEPGDPIQPELRALDAFNSRELLVGWLREHGVTTVQVGHAEGALVSGTAMIVKTRPGPLSETVIAPSSMVIGSLSGEARRSGDKSPGTRAKMIALLRQAFLDARDHAARIESPPADAKPARNLRLEALDEVLTGKRPLLLTVHREQDIRSALRLMEEFRLHLVLDGCAEIAGLLDEVKASGCPVIVHPTMTRSSEECENLSMETAGKLAQAGIPFAFQSGHESYVPKTRVVLFEAAQAATNGLGADAALEALTRGAARILGIDSRVGSLEPGRDGDVVVFDGDPFEWTTHVTSVVIDGRLVSETRR